MYGRMLLTYIGCLRFKLILYSAFFRLQFLMFFCFGSQHSQQVTVCFIMIFINTISTSVVWWCDGKVTEKELSYKLKFYFLWSVVFVLSWKYASMDILWQLCQSIPVSLKVRLFSWYLNFTESMILCPVFAWYTWHHLRSGRWDFSWVLYTYSFVVHGLFWTLWYLLPSTAHIVFFIM